MVKVAFAVIVRLWFLAVPGALTTSAAQLLGALGAVAIVWGSVTALRATGLKRLIASSTVAQLGLLFLLPPLVRAGEVDAWTGGIVLAVTHAVAKAAMLMAAAVIVDSARRAGFGAGEEGEHVTEAAQLAADAESGGPVREGPARPAADGGDGGPVRRCRLGRPRRRKRAVPYADGRRAPRPGSRAGPSWSSCAAASRADPSRSWRSGSPASASSGCRRPAASSPSGTCCSRASRPGSGGGSPCWWSARC
jgi:hypothetical protein